MVELGFIDITDKEFHKLSSLVYEKFGINLTEKKKALVRSRLNKVIRQKGFKSFGEYYQYVIEDQSGTGLINLVDKISTNHTYFFREHDHFDFFSTTEIPLIDRVFMETGEKEYRFWCAGCATGEEAYTVAILFSEYRRQNSCNWTPKILATDISVSALEHASEGIYTEERMERIPKDIRVRYFKKLGPGKYEVIPEIKKMVLFKKLNFMRPEFPFKNKFHTIFCRNVMIYFDKETKNSLVNKFARYLRPKGHLFIGHSETLGRENANFKYLQPALYEKLN